MPQPRTPFTHPFASHPGPHAPPPTHPHQIFFDDVHVDADSILLGPGRGFEIAQGRLGPGRIHHCMRLVGLAERCAYLAARRASARAAFGSQLEKKDLVRASVAEMRIQIEQVKERALSRPMEVLRHRVYCALGSSAGEWRDRRSAARRLHAPLICGCRAS
jgi:alkylation response protein AidB-like acyl-CoA dehydrogenase